CGWLPVGAGVEPGVLGPVDGGVLGDAGVPGDVGPGWAAGEPWSAAWPQAPSTIDSSNAPVTKGKALMVGGRYPAARWLHAGPVRSRCRFWPAGWCTGRSAASG